MSGKKIVVDLGAGDFTEKEIEERFGQDVIFIAVDHSYRGMPKGGAKREGNIIRVRADFGDDDFNILEFLPEGRERIDLLEMNIVSNSFPDIDENIVQNAEEVVLRVPRPTSIEMIMENIADPDYDEKKKDHYRNRMEEILEEHDEKGEALIKQLERLGFKVEIEWVYGPSKMQRKYDEYAWMTYFIREELDKDELDASKKQGVETPLGRYLKIIAKRR